MIERLRGDRRSRAQTQEFSNLTTELLAGQRGPETQLEGLRVGVKLEKPESHDGTKGRDLDTWLFQVQEHLQLTFIPEKSYVPYGALLLHGNAALLWREKCESGIAPLQLGNSFCTEDACPVLSGKL